MFSELSTIGAINADKKEDGEEEGGEESDIDDYYKKH